MSRPKAEGRPARFSALAGSAHTWIEALRQLNHWRPHGSPTEAERKARASLEQRDSDEAFEPMAILALLESQTLVRRRRSTEWATTWAAINDVLCIELETLMRRPEEQDDANLPTILEGARRRRFEFRWTTLLRKQ